MLRIKFPKMLQNPTLSSHVHAILGLSWWLSGKEFAGDAGLIPGLKVWYFTRGSKCVATNKLG